MNDRYGLCAYIHFIHSFFSKSCLGYLYQTEGTGENEKVTLSSYYQFVIFCFVLRSVMAVGTAFNETAAVSIMTISFKHSLSSAQVIQNSQV